MSLRVSEGYDLLLKGEYEDALNVLNAAFEEGIARSSAHFVDSLDAQLLMALALEQLRRYPEALYHSREAYRRSVLFYGNDNLKTLLLLRSVGYILEKQEKYDEALLQYQELYDKQRRVLGADHEESLITLSNVASVLSKQGADVTKIYESFSNYIKLANPNKHSTLLIKSNLALYLSKQRRFDEALKLLNEVNATNNEIRPKHLDTFNCLEVTATVLNEQGKNSNALEIVDKVLEKKAEMFGPDHPQTLKTVAMLRKLEKWAFINKRLGEKLVFLKEVYRKRTDILGATLRETLMVQENTAEMLLDLKKYNEALNTYNDILEKKKGLGLDLYNTFQIRTNIGTALIHLGKYDEALSVFQDIAELQNNLSPDHPEVLETRIRIAKTLAYQSKFDKALEMISKVSEIRVSLFGLEHKMTLATRCNFATTLKMQGKCDEALKIYLDVQNVLKKSNNPDDDLSLNILYHIANIYSIQGNFVESHNTYALLYAKEVPIRSDDHPNALAIQSNIALILALQGKYKSSIEKLQEVYDKQISILGKEHPYTLKSEKLLQFIRNMMTSN